MKRIIKNKEEWRGEKTKIEGKRGEGKEEEK